MFSLRVIFSRKISSQQFIRNKAVPDFRIFGSGLILFGSECIIFNLGSLLGIVSINRLAKSSKLAALTVASHAVHYAATVRDSLRRPTTAWDGVTVDAIKDVATLHVFYIYRVAQNKIPHWRICIISVTGGLILKILEAT